MSEGVFLTSDKCRLAYEDKGEGRPVIWQHGLGADRGQPAEVFPSIGGFRRIILECRGHGASELGDPNHLSIARFTEDAVALLDNLKIDNAVVGGISLGAAIALRLAALHPDRVTGLILARSAWMAGPSPETQAPYVEVAQLIRNHGVDQGAHRFKMSKKLAAVEAISSDNAKSLRWFFERSNPSYTVELLSRIPKDSPGINFEAIAQIKTPTLVIANAQDYIHPLKFAETLHSVLPNSVLRTITSKTIDRGLYISEFRRAIAEFLNGLAAS